VPAKPFLSLQAGIGNTPDAKRSQRGSPQLPGAIAKRWPATYFDYAQGESLASACRGVLAMPA